MLIGIIGFVFGLMLAIIIGLVVYIVKGNKPTETEELTEEEKRKTKEFLDHMNGLMNYNHDTAMVRGGE